MKASSRRTSPIRQRLLKIIGIGAVTLLLVLFVPRLLAGVASIVMTPVQATKTWLAESTSDAPSYIRDRATLVDEISVLKQELLTQQSTENSVTLLSQENVTLRELLGNTEEERILAGIIGRPNQLPYDVLVIDRGSIDGVVEGAPVFAGKNSAIGVVLKVFSNSSVVELITTPGFVSSVYIVGPDIYTNAEGIGGGQLRVGVPQGIEMNVGDVVILPSIESGMYGAINYVESVPSRPEQYGYVSSSIPIASLRLVSVGRAPLEFVSFEDAQEIVENTKADFFTVQVPENILIQTDSSPTTTATTTIEGSLETRIE